MDELGAILAAWETLPDPDAAVLATVVHVEGSAYRRPGARMLILPGGERIGTVSGGCLESDVCRKAWWYTAPGEGTAHGKQTLRVYDTSSGDDAIWEFGLGCNGKVHVLLERAGDSGAGESLRFLATQRKLGEASVIATVMDGPDLGARTYFQAAGYAGGAALCPELADHADSVAALRKSRLVKCGESQVFVEWVGLPQRLIVFGAGHDAVPLVSMAAALGWDVTVFDSRSAYARPDRFPGASKVEVLLPGMDAGVTEDTAVVMMTHNFPLDRSLVPSILAAKPLYLGILGPKRRAEQLFGELGMEQPSFVHAPIGLDIGADQPAQIALSILAEVQAALAHRDGGMLRFRRAPIHDPVPISGDMANFRGIFERPEVCGVLAE